MIKPEYDNIIMVYNTVYIIDMSNICAHLRKPFIHYSIWPILLTGQIKSKKPECVYTCVYLFMYIQCTPAFEHFTTNTERKANFRNASSLINNSTERFQHICGEWITQQIQVAYWLTFGAPWSSGIHVNDCRHVGKGFCFL